MPPTIVLSLPTCTLHQGHGNIFTHHPICMHAFTQCMHIMLCAFEVHSNCTVSIPLAAFDQSHVFQALHDKASLDSDSLVYPIFPPAPNTLQYIVYYYPTITVTPLIVKVCNACSFFYLSWVKISWNHHFYLYHFY